MSLNAKVNFSNFLTAGAVAAVNNNQVQYPEIHGSSVALRQALDMPQINASLSVEQSQYFKSLSSQNSNQQASMNAYQVPQPVQYSASYASNNSYVDQVVSSQQAPTRKQRARVPPPSKIPSTAVEMPGDTLNNIGYLDVQFGQLEFGNEEAFDVITDKFNATIDSSQSVTGDVTADYQTKSSVQQQQNVLASQMIPSADVLSGQNDGLSTAYNQRGGSVQQSVSVGSNISNSAGKLESKLHIPTPNCSNKTQFQLLNNWLKLIITGMRSVRLQHRAIIISLLTITTCRIVRLVAINREPISKVTAIQTTRNK